MPIFLGGIRTKKSAFRFHDYGVKKEPQKRHVVTHDASDVASFDDSFSSSGLPQLWIQIRHKQRGTQNRSKGAG
jgi:hypothetical protein